MVARLLPLALAAALACLLAPGALAATCMPRVGGCAVCGPKGCVRCLTGYWLPTATAPSCRRCPATCDVCKRKAGKAYCTLCKPGNKLKDGQCTARKTPCPQVPQWDVKLGWVNVYGRSSAGKCVACKPTGTHASWCHACDGDSPAFCTECIEAGHFIPAYHDAAGRCQSCTAKRNGCFACENVTGRCLVCNSAAGYVSDGRGGCVKKA